MIVRHNGREFHSKSRQCTGYAQRNNRFVLPLSVILTRASRNSWFMPIDLLQTDTSRKASGTPVCSVFNLRACKKFFDHFSRCVELNRRFPASVVPLLVYLFSDRRRATTHSFPCLRASVRRGPSFLTDWAWTTPADNQIADHVIQPTEEFN